MGSNTESLAYDPRPQLEDPGPPIQALPQQLAGTQQAVPQQGWYNNLGSNVGGFMQNLGGYASKLAPALASAGQVALKGSGANKTWGNAFGDLAQGLVSGKLGGNLTKSGVPKAAPATPGTSAKPMPQSPQVKVNITGSLQDFNNDGVISKEEAARSQQPPAQSRIASFSPGGVVNNPNLPGLLGQGPTKQSFSDDSGVSTGSPESVVNAPVGGASPEERSNMLMYLGGLLGPEAALNMANTTATQRINERKAEAEGVAANASLQKAYADMKKADLEGAKFRYELGPVDANGKIKSYVERQGAIEEAKKMGDRKAELWLTRELQMEADKIEVTDPALRKIGSTYGDIMRKSGTTKIDGIISTVISAGAKVTAANINAGATRDAASIMTADQIAKAINQENATLGQEKRAIMSDVRNREDSIMYAPSKEVKASIQAEIGRLKLRSAVIEERMNDNSLALKGLSSGATPQKTSTVSDNIYKSKEDIKAAIKKGKVKDGDSVTVDGKTFTVKMKGK